MASTITLIALFILGLTTLQIVIGQPSPASPIAIRHQSPASPIGFRFPETKSKVLPNPSHLGPEVSKTLLPTNSFFQNFVLNNGDQPEYFHPYLIKSSKSSLTLSYPTRTATSAYIIQTFSADLTISAAHNNKQETHVISDFNDMSVTLDFPSSNLSFFLVRGSPYVTCNVTSPTAVSISTIHAILSLSSNTAGDKHTITLNNGQTWLIYSSSPITFTTSSLSLITSNEFSGVIRVALLPGSDVEHVLDKYNSVFPVSGEAVFTGPSSLEYRWSKSEGSGDLLMLAHPLHLELLSHQDSDVTVLELFKYKSIDGDLVGVVGNSWVLKTKPIPVTWHSINGAKSIKSNPEIISALSKDVAAITSTPISPTDSYFYGKHISKAARLALIAEEVGEMESIPAITKFLKDAIEPWLDGTFKANGFLYDATWGGLVTQNGAEDGGADFGFGMYNDHHYHIGYFLYAISVVAKFDPAWGMKYKAQAYALAGDLLNLDRLPNSDYPRLRNFDLYKLHSWAGGVTEFADGRNQESTSEAVNAYYAGALLGLAYGDTDLTATASLLTALEIQASQKWWHVHQGDNLYEDVFVSANKVIGIVWSNKRDTGLWFAPPESREIRLGIQVLPISPITEVLFSNVSYVKELVDWTAPALIREGVTDAWRGFTYSLEGMYNKDGALQKIRNLGGIDDGNSLTNLLWWIHSRV